MKIASITYVTVIHPRGIRSNHIGHLPWKRNSTLRQLAKSLRVILSLCKFIPICIFTFFSSESFVFVNVSSSVSPPYTVSVKFASFLVTIRNIVRKISTPCVTKYFTNFSAGQRKEFPFWSLAQARSYLYPEYAFSFFIPRRIDLGLVETKVVFCHFKGVADLRAGFESFPVGTQRRTGSTGSIEKPSGFETVSRRCTG